MDSRKNKILIISLAYHPFVGGAEVAIKEITDRLASDFDFDMITCNLDGRQKDFERLGNISVYRIGAGKWSKYLFPWQAYRKALELQKKNNYSLVWAMMANQAGWAAKKFKNRFPAVKYLLTLQEGDSDFDIWLRTWFIRPLYKNIYRRADYIQAISNFLANRAKKLGAKCPIEVVPNGVDSEWFTQMDYDDLFRLRKSQMFGGHSILTTSRLVKKNGVEYLIRAMSNIDGRLNILGDGKLSRKLKRLSKELKIENKVQFLGFVNKEKILDSLIDASVFCRPSLSEGLGNSFLEAMAVKIPVIATPVGGIPDFLKDTGPDQTGWFCEVRNPHSIAEKINYVLDEKNQPEVKRVVENARRLVEEKYDWRKIASEMNTIFAQAINKQKNVLIATGIYPPDIGGPATIIGELKKSLEQNDFGVKVITYSDGAFSVDDVVRIKKNRRFAKLSYLFNLFRLSFSADIIYATDTYSVGYFAYLLKKLWRKPYIIRFAGDSAWETAFGNGWTTDYIVEFQKKTYSPKIEKMKARRAKILRSADKVIAVSNFMSEVAQAMGTDKSKIKVIYNSVDFENIKPISRDELEKKFGLAHEDKLIMTACRLTAWKGVDGLIKAIKGLRKVIPVKLMVLGGGPEEGKLKGLAKELGVGQDVIFAGIINQDEVIGYLQNADVFILNTYYEGLSHTLLEAVKAKVPIIASNAGGNPEVIQSGANGILADYNDQAQIEEAIKLILENKDKADGFVAAASAQASKFSWDNVVKQTIEAINNIR